VIRRVVRARREFATDTVGLYFIEYQGNGTLKYGSLDSSGQILYNGEEIKQFQTHIPKPVILIPKETLMECMSELSGLGVEPDSSAHIRGKLDATEKHLEDMRTLVFEGKK